MGTFNTIKSVNAFRDAHCRHCVLILTCPIIKLHEEENGSTPSGKYILNELIQPDNGACRMFVARPKKRQAAQINMDIEVLPFDGEDFGAAWESWKAHRKAMKRPLTPQAIKLQLRNLTALGKALAIEAIEHSISRGYQGIFPPPESAASEPIESDRSAPPCANWREKAEKLLGRRVFGDWQSLERTEHGIRERIEAV